jgi:hypothetical protein
MEINTNKTELISNVHEKNLEITLTNREILAKQEAIIKSPNPLTHAVKYLGIWLTAKLDWTKAIECACRSFKSKLTRIQNKRVPIEVKVEVMNLIINKSLEYTLGFTVLSEKKLKDLSDSVGKCFKYAMKINSSVTNAQLYASESKEGLSINHVNLVQDTAIITNAMRTYFQCSDGPCKETSMIRLKDNTFIKDIGWTTLSNQQHIPKETKKQMIINDDDDFLTKTIKVLYRRNL